ncbi:hypothetical protein PSQ40_17990 [Curvibacter sp. HBC61]|uniref:Plasmid replication/partition related protein n=1 Tax=Curvibacter cyanobacteriorum TaxID=3026422 RepID=A0ABT5N2I8_9BURK|nr:hypothetical protein [Curvibacter sp. HBC61]MDD0840475.1 hypothetical protein [Curvibacter sp. HBC61]
MDITVNEELLAYIDPLTPDEHAALERSILAEGCRDALVLWGDVLVDGHNRYGICQKHGLPFNTVQNTQFKSMDDVRLWMIDQHLGRRSLSDFQRGVLALRKKDILASREPAPKAPAAPSAAPAAQAGDSAAVSVAADATEAPLQPWEDAPGQATEGTASAAAATATAPATAEQEAVMTREALAKAARISSATISQIEKIQKEAAPELVAAVKSGTISINAAATVASLPMEEQVAAAAGGKKELQQAARKVRAAKAVERTEPETPEGTIARLRQTIVELQAENSSLKAELAQLKSLRA